MKCTHTRHILSHTPVKNLRIAMKVMITDEMTMGEDYTDEGGLNDLTNPGSESIGEVNPMAYAFQ